MQPKKYAIFASMSVKTLGLALASSCLIFSGADAAGLGKLTVLSALGQPLRAEIELTSFTNDDIGNTVPKLASQEAFRQANIDFNSNLLTLRFAVEQRGTRHYVLVTSTQSVNEPFVEILLELNSSTGKLTREYTMLIDPLEMQTTNAASSVAPKVAPTSAPQIINAAPAPVAPAPTQSPAPAATSPVAKPIEKNTAPAPSKSDSASSDKTGEYQIKSGDTLGKIADQFKPAGVSLDQMLVAIHRSNPNVFINNNMNLLRSGRIISIPGASEIERTSAPEARKIVLAQSIDFNAYRNKLANQVAQGAPEKAAESKKVDSGKITAKVTETPTSANESKDKLKLSKAQIQEQADKKAQEEDKIAKQKALEAANARVKELEQNTAKLQGILDLKNKAAASSASASAASTAASASAAASTKSSAAAPATSVATSATASLPKIEANVPASAPAHKQTVRPKVIAAPVSEPPSFFADWLSYLPYGAVALAALGLAGIYVSKRNKKPEHFDDESILTGSSMKANSLFGSTGGQSVDTNNSVFNSNFAPSASQLDANEVDPVAEADVYIAYGRDEQAEEILREALRTQPDRQAVRVKLLEIYAHRKDTRTFETVASELYGMTGGAGPDWAQAASLGLMIDPQNPLYAGGNSGDHAAVLGASTLPVESLDPEALLGNSLSQEMLNSISAKNDLSPSMFMGDVNDSTHRTKDLNEGLDFDLGLTIPPSEPEDEFAPAKPATPAPAAPVAEAKPADDHHGNDLQFESHDFSAPAKQAAPSVSEPTHAVGTTTEEAAETENPSLDFAALDFDFDIPASKVAEHHQAEPVAHAMEEIPHFDLPPSMPAAAEVASISPSTFDFDLSGIDLELPKVSGSHSTGEPNFEPHAAPAAVAEEVGSEAVSEEEFSAEMATKLDLAVAYQEIGDKDGARELLDEVLKAGNQEQIARAKAMLQELA